MINSKYWIAYIISFAVLILASALVYFQIENRVELKYVLPFLILIIIFIFQYLFIFKPIHKKNIDVVKELNNKNTELLQLNSEIKEAQENLLKNQKMFVDLSNNIPGMIYQFELLFDGSSSFKYVSKEVENIFGITVNEAFADKTNVFSKILESDFDEFNKSILYSRDNLTNWVHDFRVDFKSKGIKWMHGESAPIKLHDRIVWHGYIYEITNQKKLETELKLSEEQFRGVFEHSAIGIALVTTDGKFKAVNKSFEQFIGYKSNELLGLNFSAFTHPDDLEIGNQSIINLMNGKAETTQFEKRYIHKNGKTIWALIAPSLVKDSNGKPIHFVTQIKDITDRKDAEQALNKTIANLTSILDASSNVAIFGYSVDGIINLFNKGAENLLGYSANEAIGKHSPTLYYRKSEIEKRLNEISIEKGHKVNIDEMFIETSSKDENDSRQWTMIRKDGSSFSAQVIITKIKNQSNELIGYLGIATDITSIKEKEKQLQYLIDVTSEQNKRLINFAHIVSHNLRSHSGNFSLLLGIYDGETLETEKEEILRLLKKASLQLTETVDNLNEVVAITANLNEQKEIINLDEEINRIQVILSGLIHENHVEVINEVDKNLIIKIVPAYLESILLNLFTNAIKYGSPKRKLVIKLSTSVQFNFNVLTIQDNGLGIDLDLHRHKIFGMYKTFHGNKDARGIGLFITKNQIEAMRGKIEVESKVDVGTTFKLYFYTNN